MSLMKSLWADNTYNQSTFLVALAGLLVFCSGLPFPAAVAKGLGDLPVATEVRLGTEISWDPLVEYASASLRVVGSEGLVYENQWTAGITPAFSIYDESGKKLSDGIYHYELRFQPTRHYEDAVGIPEDQDQDGLEEHAVKSGTFIVRNGELVPGTLEESDVGAPPVSRIEKSEVSTKDSFSEVVSDALCVNSGCSEPEDYPSIGVWPSRLKMKRGAPSRMLVENTHSGWRSWAFVFGTGTLFGQIPQFAIQDRGTDNDNPIDLRPFRIDGGAPTDSLRVSSSGNVGIGTAAPAEDLHVVGDIQITDAHPAITFDNTNGDNISWRIGEVNDGLLIRQLTGTGTVSRMSFEEDGNIGMGTTAPSESLHVRRSDGTAQVLIEDINSSSNSPLQMLKLSNKGFPAFNMEDTSQANVSWTFRLSGTQGDDERFAITKLGTGGPEFSLFHDGDVEIPGTLVEGSSRAVKDNVTPLDGDTVLAKLANLAVSEWSYEGSPGKRHAGPMAEEFHAVFGLGPDSRHIAPKDLAGVALAAAKALRARTTALKSENEALVAETKALKIQNERLQANLGNRLAERDRRIATLESRLRTMEQAIKGLGGGDDSSAELARHSP